ncbi:hypothetical protein SAMN05216226_104239 [Halovenus aranensis]|uniref:Restriction endonuclease n=1 Tax=Halovenus aranensis TaxID=890420 RepID=A0A1G8UGA8_9EURY|nr:hypothetical protein [Halovenus aranensis]SDJ52674.1 hypothetical protein SAMN05216226_104239 [Halovenus aranensis]
MGIEYARSEEEAKAIADFLSEYFPERYQEERQVTLGQSQVDDNEITPQEQEEIDSFVEQTDEEFRSSKGALGVAIDFLMVAEQLSRDDEHLGGFQPDIDRQTLFQWYDNAAKTSLTLKFSGTRYSIRSVHNEVIDLFREDLKRTNFPSSPGHHTGEWERYDDLLEASFRLSTEGRYETVQRLFNLGLVRLAAQKFETREPPFPDPLKEVLLNYPRSHPDEEGGLTYQSLAYGYAKTRWSHLSLEASKVRTGSSRQNRFGDIDGYYGPDLMVSVEVKDLVIDETNVNSELGMMMDLAERTNVVVVAMCRRVSSGATEVLEASGVNVITDSDIESELDYWDYHKQNRAIQGMVHFLGSIEEDPAAVQRLLRFIEEIDPRNKALAHLPGTPENETE